MQKSKLIIGLLGYWFIGLFAVHPAYASTVYSIQQLPSYVTTNNFKLSCTADGGLATFSVSKNGGSATNFATIDLSAYPCLVQVTGSQITEEAEYSFTVTVDSTSQSTNTTYDNSGPGSVSGYSKEGLSDGFRLHYHTPNDSDFEKVIIYRGDSAGFNADSSHEIATIGGNTNTDMTYDDHSGSNKFYYIRAIDHAGNSSALVGDVSNTTSTTTSTASPKAGTKVTVLPKEQGTGSVLGTEASPTGQPESTTTATAAEKVSPVKWVMTHKKISLGVTLGLIVVGYLLFRKKNF